MHVYLVYQNSPSKSFLTFSFWATLMNWYWTRKTTNKKTFLCLNIDVHTLNISQTWPHIWDQDYQLINQIKNVYNTRNSSSCVIQSKRKILSLFLMILILEFNLQAYESKWNLFYYNSLCHWFTMLTVYNLSVLF